MATPVETPSGKWRVRVYAGRDANGKVKCKTITAKTKREANRLAREFEAGKDIFPEDAAPRVTLEDAIEQYIDTCRVTGKSPSTIRGYVGQSKRIEADLGSRYMDSITLYEIQSWLNSLSGQISAKTIKNYWGLLTPVLRLYRPELRLDAIRLPKLEEHDVVIPTDEQVTQMLDAAVAAHDDNLYKAILLAAFCGMRRSEICALEWDDIDRRQHTISINKSRVQNEFEKFVTRPVTKTKAGKRTITLSDHVMRSLFSARTGTDKRVIPVEPSYIYNHYSRMAVRFGVPPRLHYLRHYHCSVLISLGYPEKYIIDRLGWSCVDMIHRVYGHVISEKKEALDLGLSAHTEALLEGKRYAYK